MRTEQKSAAAPVTKVRLSRIFWIGAAATLIMAALVALLAVVRGGFSDTDGRILATLAAMLYTGGALLAGLGLVERRRATWLGWTVVAAAPVTLAILLRSIWEWEGNGEGEDHWRLAWSATLALLAGLVAVTALLNARREDLVRLALTAGALAAAAATLSIVAIWREAPGDALGKTLAATWILAALAYFLVPVLERFFAPSAQPSERVLAELDDVVLVATRKRAGSVDPGLAPGERLALRRRPTAAYAEPETTR